MPNPTYQVGDLVSIARPYWSNQTATITHILFNLETEEYNYTVSTPNRIRISDLTAAELLPKP